MTKKPLEHMRDCVKQAFLKGSQRGHEFRKIRHALIYELKRLGYESSEIKDKLLEWNERCERRLGLGDQRSQLLKYVEWFESHDCKFGCNALEDFCVGKENCQYYKIIAAEKRKETQSLPFDLQELNEFLEKRFKVDGQIMIYIVKALRWQQQEKATGENILIGYRKIASIIRDKFGHIFNAMDIFRKMQLLIDEGIIEQVVKGKAGNFTKQANGYRFRPWQAP